MKVYCNAHGKLLFPKELVLKALEVVPSEHLKGLRSIVVRVYPTKEERRRMRTRNWKHQFTGRYRSSESRIYIYLGPLSEIGHRQPTTPFFRAKWLEFLSTLYHEIGHHRQSVFHYLGDRDKYIQNKNYCSNSEANATSYSATMLKRAEKAGLLRATPSSFIKTGYVARRRYKEQKKVTTQQKFSSGDILILHEIRALSLKPCGNYEYAPYHIAQKIQSEVGRLSYCDGQKPVERTEYDTATKSYITALEYAPCPMHALCRKLRPSYRAIEKYASAHYGKVYTDRASRNFRYFTYQEYKAISNHFIRKVKAQMKIPPDCRGVEPKLKPLKKKRKKRWEDWYLEYLIGNRTQKYL